MKLLPGILIACCLFFSTTLIAQKNLQLASPNGNIQFSFKLLNNSPSYSVRFKSNQIINNALLSLSFDNRTFEKNLKINKAVFRDTTEDYELFTGKAKQVHTHYKKVLILLEEIMHHSEK